MPNSSPIDIRKLVLEKVSEFAEGVEWPDASKMDRTLGDHGLDSLEIVVVEQELSEAIGVWIPDGTLQITSTLAEVVKAVSDIAAAERRQ